MTDILFLLLMLLLIFGSAGFGIWMLYKNNQEKTRRTQAMFGVGAPGPGMQPQGQPLARVVGKRTHNWSDRTAYYVAFQAPGAQPVELEVPAEWFQYLNQGDLGALTLQGGHFAGFQKVS